MTTVKIIHPILEARRADEIDRAVPPPVPRLGGHDVAPLAILLAGVAGLLAIAAPSM